MVAAIGWRNGTHLDDQVALRVPGHPAELGRQLLELRPAVGVNHPAWRGERVSESGGGRLKQEVNYEESFSSASSFFQSPNTPSLKSVNPSVQGWRNSVRRIDPDL